MKSPFKFLDSYTLSDRDSFFGRDNEIEVLYELVYKARMILVYGNSGTGKTSLIQCGLASKFDGPDWFPIYIRKKGDINASLREAISKAMKVDHFNGTLSQATEELFNNYLRPIYLIFDQFEELFILGNQKEKEQFISDIYGLSLSELPCKIIFIIREEYLGSLYEFEKRIPSLFEHRLRIEPMSHQRVKEVLTASFDKFNISVAGNTVELLEEMIDNISGEKSGIQLPYLQVYLDRLYRDEYVKVYGEQPLQQNLPPLAFSKDGIDHLGKIENVMEKFLDEQGAELGAYLRKKFSAMPKEFVRKLLDIFVTEDGTKRPVPYQLKNGQIILDKGHKELLPNVSENILSESFSHLEKSRLIRFTDHTIELAHDSLAQLIDQKRTAEQRQLNAYLRQIQHAHASYTETREYLSAKQLAVYEDSLPKLRLDSNLLDFIDASKQDAANKKEKEKKRQERELELVQQKLAAEKKVSRKQKNYSVVIGLIALVALIAGFWANQQRKISNQNTKRASLFIEFLESNNRESPSNEVLIEGLTNIVEVNPNNRSELTEYVYNLRAELFKESNLLRLAMNDYDWLIKNGSKNAIPTYCNYYLETARIAHKGDVNINLDSIENVLKKALEFTGGEGYEKLKKEIVVTRLEAENGSSLNNDGGSDVAEYEVRDNASHQLYLYQKKNIYYSPGKVQLEDFVFDSKQDTSFGIDTNLFRLLQSSPLFIDFIREKSSYSKLDSISTSFDDFIRIGILEYNLGTGDNRGSLPAFLKKIQTVFPEKYYTYFQQYGVETTDDTDLITGFLKIDGEIIDSRISKLRLKSPEYLFLFWRALQDEYIQQLLMIDFLKGLLNKEFLVFTEFVVYGFPLTDLITSETGFGQLLSIYSNNPGSFQESLDKAFLNILKQTKKLPNEWTESDELEFLQGLATLSKQSLSPNEDFIKNGNAFKIFLDLISQESNPFYSLTGSDSTTITPDNVVIRKKDDFLIFLDPAHGGIDLFGKYVTAPAKQFNHSQGNFHNQGWIYEGVLNRTLVYKVAKKLAYLEIPYIILAPNSVDVSLNDRSTTANMYSQVLRKKSILLRTDFNASGSHNARGFEIYTSKGETKGDQLAELHWQNVKTLLGDKINYRPDKSDGDYDREANFFSLTRTDMPAILIEHLFMDDYEDAKLAMTPEIIDLFAEAQVRTIIDWIREN